LAVSEVIEEVIHHYRAIDLIGRLKAALPQDQLLFGESAAL